MAEKTTREVNTLIAMIKVSDFGLLFKNCCESD